MKNSSINLSENGFAVERGFSVIELIVVFGIIAVISVMAVFTFSSTTRSSAENQALQLTDICHEARQRALSQRTTFRVQINATRKSILLIDENTPATDTDDILIRTIPFSSNGVFIGTNPSNISGAPTELSPVPAITFAPTNYYWTPSDNVATMRFLRNGTVTNGGTNGVGAGAIVTGATITIWSKYAKDTSATPTVGQFIRAVTVLGGSGLTRMWKCDLSGSSCSTWTK